MRILVAEDDRAIAGVLVELLTEEGHAVDVASSAEEALARAGAGSWDLFLVDTLGQARLGPTEAYKAFVRELSARAPVVVCTGQRWALAEEPPRLGAAAILPKPFDIDELCGTVAAVGRGR